MTKNPGENFDQVEILKSQVDLAELAYPGFRAIASDTFLNKSRQNYPPEWITREIVQNFVDANRAHTGTLDGVRFIKEQQPDGNIRYTVSGDWPFPDYTGLVTFHTDKVNDTHSAGGNGIGLKQTAQSLLIHHGARSFKVLGEGWCVEYIFKSKKEINVELEKRGETGRVENGFFMVRAAQNPNRGACHYVIEMGEKSGANEALDRFYEFGICQQNPVISEAQYRNKRGALRWLPLSEKGEFKSGRFFLNGQIYRAGEANYRDYWGGLQGVSMALHKTPYPVSMDRPPMSGSDVLGLTEGFIGEMSKIDIVENLKASEHIWAGIDYKTYRKSYNSFAIDLIGKLVMRLKDLGFSGSDFEKNFKDRKYYAYDDELPANQAKKLMRDGFILCPALFAGIGMPKVPIVRESYKNRWGNSDREWFRQADLSHPEKGRPPKKREARKLAVDKVHSLQHLSAFFELSQRDGLSVPFPKIKKVSDARDLGVNMAKERYRDRNRMPALHVVDDEHDTIQIKDWMRPMEYETQLVNSINEGHSRYQSQYWKLKGLIACGLEHGYFASFSIHQPEISSTFQIDEAGEILVIRNKKRKWYQESESEDNGLIGEIYGDTHVVIEITFCDKKKMEDFVRGWNSGVSKKEKGPTSAGRSSVSAIQMFVLASILGITSAAIWKLIEKDSSVVDLASEMWRTGNSKSDQQAELAEADNSKSDQQSGLLKVDNVEVKSLSYGQSRQRSGQGNSLIDSIVANVVSAVPSRDQEIQERVEASVTHIADPVENFEVIRYPRPHEVKQLELLREYFHLTIGHFPDVQLFIFTGEGARGIYFGKDGMIGIHIGMLWGNFESAIGTFNHEMAHTEVIEHGVYFNQVLSAIFETQLDTLGKIVETWDLNSSQARILKIEKEWNYLRAARE